MGLSMGAPQSHSLYRQPSLVRRLLPASGRPDITRTTIPRTSRRRDSSQQTEVANHNSDLLMVNRIIAGDSDAQERLVKTYTPRLYLHAFSILRNKEDAQDAVQDCWVRAYSNLRAFQGRASFFTWLTKILINSALMILRKNRKRCETSADEEGAGSVLHEIPDRSRNPEQVFFEGERKAILNEAISRLRPRIRVMVEFGELRELSVRETALHLNISTQAAKARLFHARVALRKSPVLKVIT